VSAEVASYGARVPDGEVALQRLERVLRRIDDRIRRWPVSRWTALGSDGSPRVEAAHELAVTLAELGRLAGNDAPTEVPPMLHPHAIADQLVVLGRELLNAPQAAAHAEAGVAACERLLTRL
jgi:hypothetical protein